MKHNTILLDLTVLGFISSGDELEITDKKLLKQFDLIGNYGSGAPVTRELPLVVVRWLDTGTNQQIVAPCVLIPGTAPQTSVSVSVVIGGGYYEFAYGEDVGGDLKLSFTEL